jgi:hypothetical protein
VRRGRWLVTWTENGKPRRKQFKQWGPAWQWLMWVVDMYEDVTFTDLEYEITLREG